MAAAGALAAPAGTVGEVCSGGRGACDAHPLASIKNTAFKLAERKTEATIARVFVDFCIERMIAGELDTVTASMAKYWCSQKQAETVDECLQLHGGYGYMEEYPIARMFVDARIQKIYGGANEIMKVIIARSL